MTGRIQTRSYDNQQGQRVYVTEVVAENFQMLESRSVREGHTGGAYSAPTANLFSTYKLSTRLFT